MYWFCMYTYKNSITLCIYIMRLTLFLSEEAVSLACPRLPEGDELNPQPHGRTKTGGQVGAQIR